MFECQVEVLRRDGVGVRRMVCGLRFECPFPFMEFCFSGLSPKGDSMHPSKLNCSPYKRFWVWFCFCIDGISGVRIGGDV